MVKIKTYRSPERRCYVYELSIDETDYHNVRNPIARNWDGTQVAETLRALADIVDEIER